MDFAVFKRKQTLIALALLVVAIPLTWTVKNMVWYQEQELLSLGVEAPGFTLSDENGRMYALAGFHGKVVLLTFCKTNEASCAAQALDLTRIQDRYGDRGLEVLFLANSASVKEIQDFDQAMDTSFRILQDRGGRIAKKYHVSQQPTHYFIDRNGNVASATASRFTSRNRGYRDLIESLLEEEAGQ